MHRRGKESAANSTGRLWRSLAGLLIELNADLSGPLKDMKELAERQVQKREYYGDRVKLRKESVVISAQKMSRGGQQQPGYRDGEQQSDGEQVSLELLYSERSSISRTSPQGAKDPDKNQGC